MELEVAEFIVALSSLLLVLVMVLVAMEMDWFAVRESDRLSAPDAVVPGNAPDGCESAADELPDDDE